MLHPAAASFYCNEVPKVRFGEGMSLAMLPNTLSRRFLIAGTRLLPWVGADPLGPNSSLLRLGWHRLGVATFWGRSRRSPHFAHRARA